MHDFIQSLAFTRGRALLVARSTAPGWLQCGIMRSFGQDDVAAPYRSALSQRVRAGHKSKTKSRK